MGATSATIEADTANAQTTATRIKTANTNMHGQPMNDSAANLAREQATLAALSEGRNKVLPRDNAANLAPLKRRDSPATEPSLPTKSRKLANIHQSSLDSMNPLQLLAAGKLDTVIPDETRRKALNKRLHGLWGTLCPPPLLPYAVVTSLRHCTPAPPTTSGHALVLGWLARSPLLGLSDTSAPAALRTELGHASLCGPPRTCAVATIFTHAQPRWPP